MPRKKYMTKAQVEKRVKALFGSTLASASPTDKRTAWNIAVDVYIRNGELPESAGDWTHPAWVNAKRKVKAARNPKKTAKRKTTKRATGGKAQAQRNASKAMKLSASRGISLKSAWKLVKSGKA